MTLSYTEELLGFSSDSKGKALRGAKITNAKLEEFVLGPLETSVQDYSVTDCAFQNLLIKGAFLIYEGVCLESVLFDNVNVDDGMAISCFARMSNVQFKGNERSSGLWIKPLEGAASQCLNEQLGKSRAQESKMIVDITEFYGGDVEILGLPIARIKFDRTRHFAVDNRWRAIPWDAYGIARKSFWRVRFERLDLFDVQTAVFSLPDPESKNYQSAMSELALIQSHHKEFAP